jgi:PAS domain S-box-containing protein
MKAEEIKKYMSSKIIVICTGAFILVAFLMTVSHLFVMPFLEPSIPPASMHWIEAGIDAFLVLIVGALAIYWMSRLDLERREAAELYVAMAYSSQIGVYIVQSGKFKFVNPYFQKVTGFGEDEVLGADSLSIVHPEDRKMVRENAMKMLKGGHSEPYEYRVIGSDGGVKSIMEMITAVEYRGKQAILGSWMDITERRQAEEKIRQAAEEWRTTFDSITDLVSLHDRDFKLVRVNKAFADTFNTNPKALVGATCYEVVHGTKESVADCPHKQTLETKEPATVEFFEPHLGIHFQMSTSPILDEKGEVVATVHIAKDITEHKRMEEQLAVTDRLSSIGELAAGIAHELNNPLTSVIGFSQLLLDKDVSDDVREDIKIIYREAQRSAEVVKNLLTFARKQAPVKQPVNINSVIEKVLELRAYEQRVNNIRVNTQFAPNLPEIMADYFQLQQVFLNIVINAEYFMIEAHKRGTLTITTERTGEIIRAYFTDDGPGIAEENLGHLFDPFFTTKEVGKGTGLGLSICHGIITEHGGRMYAESELGKGATFVVELPIVKLALVKKEG